MNLNRKFAILVLVIYTAISSCGVDNQDVMPTVIPTSNTLPQSATLPVATILPGTSLPTQFPTMTFVPTLSPADAEKKVIELLRTNGNCLLPCFWGFIPGQTTAKEIISFLMQVGSSDDSMLIKRDDVIMATTLEIEAQQLSINTHAYHEVPGRIEKNYGSPYYSEYFQYYSLQNLLTLYGQPEQVYIFLDTGIAEMGLGVDLYLLSIEYPTKGWLAVFEMPLRQKENIFLGCPSVAFANLRVWIPGNKPQGAFHGGFGGDDISGLFTIEEATSMTIDEFYQKFKGPTTACLETPADIHK